MNKIIYPLLSLFSLVALFFLIYEINYIARDSSVLAGDLFLTQANFKESLYMLIFLIAFFSIIRIIINKYDDLFSQYSEYKIFLTIILSSFIFKLFLIDYNHDYHDIELELSMIFNQGMFNQYKTYSFIILFINQLTDNPAKILTLMNSMMSSLTMGLIYLILKKIKLPSSIIAFSIILLVGYIPFQVNDVLIRVDNLFILLFTLILFLILEITQNYTSKKLLLLNLLAIIICFTRESTLYFLPIFILILLLCKKKKVLSISALSATIIFSSFFLSNLNKHHYGISSYIKDFHLGIKMQNYGYLNQNIIDRYIDHLTPSAKSLLRDIKKSYDINVLPHKREAFTEEKFSDLQNNPADSFLRKKILHFFQYVKYQGLGYLIRPDMQNVVAKNSMTLYQGDLGNVRNNYNSILEKSESLIVSKDLYYILKTSEKNLSINVDKVLAKYVRGLLLENPVDCQSKKLTYEDMEGVLEKKCIIDKLHKIDENFMQNQSDNWIYKKTIMPFTLSFDKEQKRYDTHPHINKIQEILLSKPFLYVSQSLITFFSMSGYVPIPSTMATHANVYSNSIYPDIFKMNFQKIYFLIINFWYVLCFMVFLIFAWKSILERKLKNEIFIAIIPLYYGLFIAFASPFEFNRLMLPIAPYIIISFSIITYSISNIVLHKLKK